MQDPIEIDHDPAVTRSGQSVLMSVYRTKIGDKCRLITITWCKNVLLHGLSVSIHGENQYYTCKVELKPFYFWRKKGSKRFIVDSKAVDIYWDLKSAKFNGETEPISEYYVAVVCNEEVVLLVGDLKKDAYRKTGCRPALIDPILVSRKEHVFGKKNKKLRTRVKFDNQEKGSKLLEVSIECKNVGEPEMEMRIDGDLVIHVKHLQWKFRGNETIQLNKLRVEVYWDVHDWLFSPGLRHALFIFKPIIMLSSSSSSSPLSSSCSSSTGPLLSGSSVEGINSTEFSLFLYAWKVK